jgi:uncharacterized protein YcbK (DUF882 family)
MRLAHRRLALALAWALARPAFAQSRPDAGPLAASPERGVEARPAPSVAPRIADRPATVSPDPRYASLPALTWRSNNTRETVEARLYLADGTVDTTVIERLSRLLRDTATGEPSPVVPRTLQLIVKVAARFDARTVEIVSAYRTGRTASGRRVRREGYHGVGSAIDFRLPGIETALVAAYARTLTHAGVGFYPRLDFVHLDSREQSYAWVNAAGRSHHGWNRPLARPGVAERDRAWSPEADLPWDPPGVVVALDTTLRTAPGAHRPHRRQARRDRRRHRHHRGARGARALHVFSGQPR